MTWLQLAQEQAARFWSKVDKSGECWLWQGAVDKDGYGKFQLTTRTTPKQIHVRAHRVSIALYQGTVPPSDLVAIHSCDNPRCVRPEHLTLGTQADNREDCGRKNRNATGARNGKHTRPDKKEFGDAHWTRRLPERVCRGAAWHAARARKRIERGMAS